MRHQRRILGALAITATAATMLAPAAHAGPIPGPAIDFSFAKITMDGRSCSGVLVSNDWVVTAASCFPENPQGGTPAKAASAVFTGQTVKITKLVTRTDRDLVLAQLEVPVAQVIPMELAITAPTAGEAVRADGFGRTATEWVPATGHRVDFTVAGVAATTFSATAVNGVDTCKGDAGGPMVHQVGATLQLVGIHSTSWQHGCLGETETRSGSTETRTDDIADWIRQNTPAVEDPNFAIQKHVTVSSSHEADGWAAAKLTDGAEGGWSSENDLGENHTEWAAVDLAGLVDVDRIDLYPRSDGANTGIGFPSDFTIETSVDGQNWTPVVTRKGVPRPGAAPLEFSLGGKAIGQVRITGTNLQKDPFGTYRMQLAEIAVYGDNWATNAQVITSSTQEVPSIGWGAGYAVDGVRSSNGTGELGWTSGIGPAGRSEWIEVHDISYAPGATHVDLYPRGDFPDGSVGFPSTFTVEGSTDGTTWTQLASGPGTPIAGTAARRLSFPSTGLQYVKVTGSGFKADPFGNYYMQIGEIEVY